jgi:glycosyltransferase involved in cell wall biosynthesis
MAKKSKIAPLYSPKSGSLPVFVCSIAKNEAKHVRRWAESAKDADAIFLLDTGSTDDTIKIAKECGIVVFERIYEDWSFAVARNDLRDMLPEQDAWLINLDLDELFVPGWRPHLDVVDLNVNRPRYDYDWNWTAPVIIDGEYDVEATRATNSVGLSYRGDKIVRRHSHKWVNRVHEVNVAVAQERQGWTNLRIQHFADNSKPRSSYLPLLLLDVEENPENDRNTYYAARELMYYGRTEESIALFKQHLSLKSAVWEAERAFSMRYIAKQSPVGSHEREQWLLRSVAEWAHGRECWVELAQHYQDTKNWVGMYDAVNRALSITNRGDLYLTEALMWGWLPHDLCALAAAQMDIMNIAVTQGQIALSMAPDDERMKNNLYFYKAKHAKVDVVIPTKSNLSGLTLLIAQLKRDYKVNRIVVVADGQEAYEMLSALPDDIIKLMVPLGIGIHRMWNTALKVLGTGNYVAFINDDISLAPFCMSTLMDCMLHDPSIGMICPNYSQEPNVNDTVDRDVFGVSGSRYDGWGGMAGFCFMVAKDLVPHWRFDESLRWLAGDNDVVDWVTQVVKRRAVITHKTRCKHADSKTFNDDPPPDWLNEMHRDKLVYEKKRKAIDNGNNYESGQHNVAI